MSQKNSKITLMVAGLAFSTWLSAQGSSGQNYTPPSTPELYDVNEPLVPAYVRIKKVKSHPYLGLGIGFGSSRNNGGNGTPKASWNLVAEGGYVKALTSWTRVDVGLEAFTGKLGDSLNDMKVNVGGLAKVGYGYNLSENLYALLRLGYGLAVAKYSGPMGDSSSVTGYLWQVGLQMIVPTDSSVDLLGGFFFNQYGFSDKGTYNAYEARIGMRYRI